MRIKSISGLIALAATVFAYWHPTAYAAPNSPAIKAFKHYQRFCQVSTQKKALKAYKIEQFLKKI